MRAQSNGDEDADLVYAPMLFESTGYTSSELYRDSFEMRSRLPTGPSSVPLLGVKTTAEETQERIQGIKSQIRLETLSSRAATTVVWVTYLSFLLAIVLPYLQGKGYLETAVELSGAVCTNDVRRRPCIEVDTKQKVAQWTAYVVNVSRYTENVELKLRVRTLVKSFASSKMLNLIHERMKAHERIDTVWVSTQDKLQARDKMQDQGLDSFIVENDGYVLTYDVKLYGFDQDVIPATKDVIVDDHNQSVWVECQVGKQCDEVSLVEITQDVDRLGGSGYNAYFVIVMFRGLYPNVFGKDVVYDFTFTKPAIQIGEVVVRGILVLVTILGLPCWLISVLNFHDRSWSKVLTVQKWLLGVSVVLVLWQNPVYTLSELYTTMSMRTRFVLITCQSLAEAFFYVIWLSLIDQYCVRRSLIVVKFLFGLALFGVDTLMTVLRMPGLFSNVGIMSSSPRSHDELYTVLGFIRTGLLLVWLVWIIQVGAQSGRHLKALPYMATRYKQLSYRFLVLQTFLIFIYIFVLSTLQTFYLLRTWSIVGYNAFIQDSVHYFAKMHTGHPSLGQFLFLSVNVYLVMYVHLPPLASDRSGFLVSTAIHVDNPTRAKSYEFIPSNPSLFCVKTAAWLLELAYQAYFDPPGCPSLSGYGELSLEQHGFELITHLRNNRTDTHVVVAWSQADHRRLVISFRGTTSKENWKSNLRADQTVLWIKSRGLRWRKSCVEKVKDVAAKIPLLNIALPRVHRGFWLAYESIRDELKEVTRLILDENPGISVYITGHSMGGALAVLAAYDLAVNFTIQVNMYNFGGPRVGNPSFRQHYDSCVSTSYRVVMDGDIVPGWPKFWGLYQHVGTEISLDVVGNVIVDPSFIERHLHHSSRRKTTMHGTNLHKYVGKRRNPFHRDVLMLLKSTYTLKRMNGNDREAVIRSHTDLAEAAANGSRAMVELLLDNGVQIDAPGRDGTTPLCAAALWGNDVMVTYLLDKGAEVSAQNEVPTQGTGWTALHAASFQEHGKVVRILLAYQADPRIMDAEGRRAADYASISEAIWPYFSAQGCVKSHKSELVAKGIIRKIQEQPEQSLPDDKYESISFLSRPGSAYARAQMHPPLARRLGSAVKSRDGQIIKGPIDPLGDVPSEIDSNQRPLSLKRMGI